MSFTRVGHCFSTNFSSRMNKMGQTKYMSATIEIRHRRKYQFLVRRGEYTRMISERELPTAVKLFHVKISCLINPPKCRLFISDMISSIHLNRHLLKELEQQIKAFVRTKAEEAVHIKYDQVEMILEITDSVIELYDEDEAISQAATDSMDASGSVPVPASQVAIQALKTEKYDGRDLGGNCSICLDEFSDGMEVTCMPCSHIFHYGCILRWLEQINMCPLCRHPI